MGKMGNTWRRVETITKTGETDQGLTLFSSLILFTYFSNLRAFSIVV
jgi:hypothetical protein